MRHIAIAASVLFFMSGITAATPNKGAVTEIRPDNAFMAFVSPFTSRLKEVRYYEAGPNLIGVYGKNPLAKSDDTATVLFFFDKSGEYMLVGNVVDWKKQRNLAEVAIRQFEPNSSLAKEAEEAQKLQDTTVEKYKVALETDIAAQRAAMQKMNEKAGQKVDLMLKEGIPAIQIGQGPKRIVAFVDLTCKHCMAAIKDLLVFGEGPGKSTHTIRLVLTANPKDALNTNTTAMIYGSPNQLAQLKATIETNQRYNGPLVKAGTPALTRVQSSVHALEIRTFPYFVIGSGSNAKKQTGYGSLQDLIK